MGYGNKMRVCMCICECEGERTRARERSAVALMLSRDSSSSHPAKVLFFATTDLPVAEQYSSFNSGESAPPEHGRRRRGTATRNLPNDVTVQAKGLTPIATIESFGEHTTKLVLSSPITAKFLLISTIPFAGIPRSHTEGERKEKAIESGAE